MHVKHYGAQISMHREFYHATQLIYFYNEDDGIHVYTANRSTVSLSNQVNSSFAYYLPIAYSCFIFFFFFFTYSEFEVILTKTNMYILIYLKILD